MCRSECGTGFTVFPGQNGCMGDWSIMCEEGRMVVVRLGDEQEHDHTGALGPSEEFEFYSEEWWEACEEF